MTIEQENTPTEQPVAPATDTNSQTEIKQLKAQLAAQQLEMDSVSSAVLATIPDGLKALIPDELSPAGKVRWYQKVQAAGLLAKPVVPVTDTNKPNIMQPQTNPDDLPPIARMSCGYGK